MSREHSLELVSRSDADQSGDSCIVLPFTSFLVGVPEPKCVDSLVGEDIVPVVR